jgi:hypothetical protein
VLDLYTLIVWFLCLFVFGTRLNPGTVLVRQVLYCLSHIPSSFVFILFLRQVLLTLPMQALNS